MKNKTLSIIKLRIFVLWTLILVSANLAYSQNRSDTALKKNNQKEDQKTSIKQDSVTLKNIEDIYDIFAVSENEIWLIGKKEESPSGTNILLHSKDGGNSWKSVSAGYDLTYARIFFISKDVAFVTGRQITKDRQGIYKSSILKSTDGGVSWRKLAVTTEDYLFNIQFINDRQGWAVGDGGTILRTNDGGESWKTSRIDGVSLLNVFDGLDAFGFKDEMNGWATEKEKVYRTSDGGITWTNVSKKFTDLLKKLKPEEIEFRKIKFFSKTKGIIVAQYKSEYTEIEGGESKTYTDYGGVIFSTEDGGETWKMQEFTNRGFLTADFSDENNLWVIPSYGWKEEMILYSSDGGKNWIRVSTGSIGDPFEVKFVNKNHGWLAASGGRLYRTIDGGNTWESLNKD